MENITIKNIWKIYYKCILMRKYMFPSIQQGEMVADVKTLLNASVLDNIRVVFGVAVSRYFYLTIFLDYKHLNLI